MGVAGELRFERIVKAFGGAQALKGVSLSARRGEALALLGENGAGKSTLIKILGGVHKADSGRIAIDGEPYVHRPPRRSERQAVGFVHQDLGLLEWMTVAENVGLAGGYASRPVWGRLGVIDWDETTRVAARALALVGCDIDPTARVHTLSRTEKSLVAIARALVVECDYLVLDEPTASLPADEVERLFAAMRRLKEAGVGMIYVSHRLDEVFRIADRVAVLRDGLLVGEQAVSDTTPEALVGMIVGRDLGDGFVRPPAAPGSVRLSARGLRTASAGPVDFDLRDREILGLVGLRGAGQEEIGRALFGAVPHAGRIVLDGAAPDLSLPAAALLAGVGLIARDRTEESIAPSLSVRENAFLNPAAAGRSLASRLSPRREAQAARSLGAAVGLRPNDPSLPIESLSGGNQQKVVVGRWLATGRRLLIAEDPTSGVDVGAKAEIYRLIAGALERGLAVAVVSTDFEEVAHLCHRALVFNRGRIVGDLSGPALTARALVAAASASEAA
ncbi:sugar ABC transporter ATP-binding protein [Alsobacter sp. KACC 23698]|uniref:Sugar ABC transporter ATP-binding protein n=1 Tax=Alsobacter sp. KACC 23698 TaxID=3149229 RepID=A0AAU7JC63_9HYPH